MGCYCYEIGNLREDINKLNNIVADLENIHSDFNAKFKSRKTEMKSFFAPVADGYYFRVNEYAMLCTTIDEFEKNLPDEFLTMVDDIESCLVLVRAKLSVYESWDRSYHESLENS